MVDDDEMVERPVLRFGVDMFLFLLSNTAISTESYSCPRGFDSAIYHLPLRHPTSLASKREYITATTTMPDVVSKKLKLKGDKPKKKKRSHARPADELDALAAEDPSGQLPSADPS